MLGVKSSSSFDDIDEEICAAFWHLEQKDLKVSRFPLKLDATQPRGVFKPVPIRYTKPVIYGEGGPNFRIRITENILTKDMCEGYDAEIMSAFGHIEEKDHIEETSTESDDFDEISLGDPVEAEIQKTESKPRSLLKRFLNLFRRMRL